VPNTLLYEVSDRVAVITLNRPERLNAYTPAMGEEIVAAFDETDADDGVRAVVVTGAGRAFCAGSDLGGGARTFDRSRVDADAVHRDSGGLVALRIFRSLKPVIAAMNGSAVGIGATMTLPMDVRVLAEGAKVGFVFGARGIVLDAAASWFLPRIVGVSRALEWSLTGRVFTAEEALSGGLVRSVHPAETVLEVATDLAAEMVANVAPVSAVLTRQMIWQMLGARHPMEAHRIDSRAIQDTGRMADSREGVTAFLEKRPAQWSLAPSRDLPSWFPWSEEPPFAP
jgi:enoyl-CoA hydratase/carnithine racemase